ncbi:MAG: hypothetical protein SFU83_12225 [Meiothermus sp.]|nr:hypothetical protein [Meiothermus sp.]
MKRLILPSLLLLLAACTSPPQNVTVVRPETKVLGPAVRGALEEFRPDGTLVFPAGTAFKAGDVLVSEPTAAAPNGLLLKVTATEQSGGKTLVRTEQAALGDALQKGRLSAERELTEADLASVVPASGARLGEVRAQADGLKLPFSLVVLDRDDNPATTNDRVAASGELTLKPIIKVDLDLDCGFLCVADNDLDFKGELGLEFVAKLGVKADALGGLTLKKTVPIATLNFTPKTFFIGPVPVVITPKLVLELKFEGKAGLKVGYEISYTLKAVAGAKYDDGWKNISDFVSDFKSGPVDATTGISGVLEAKAKAAARAELMFYGVVGPTIEVAPSAKLDLMYPRDPLWKLFAGIEANVGINIKVLGFSKSYSTNLRDDSVEIARAANTPPDVSFLSSAGAADLGTCCNLRVRVLDAEDGPACCQVSFRSSRTGDGVGGALGNASGVQPELPYTFTTLGTRTITATAVDSKGATRSATLEINVVNTPPTLAISSPFGGQQLFRGVSYRLRGVSFDRNEAGFELPCDSLRWTSSVAGDNLSATGCSPSASFATNGPRTLTLTGTDPQGATGTATVSVTVVDPPANLPPVVNLTSPQNNITIGPDQLIRLGGTAADPEGSAVTLSWDVTTGYNPATGTGAQTFPVTPAANGDWRPTNSITYTTCEVSDTLRLRLRARDAQSNEGFDFIVIRVNRIC